ncbi:MAG: TolC family outer membrane protein [Alphaproteobacteria bacterium]|nr:TolC family outer membrane protein [Alphaproteobacteria bacterium]
MRRGAVLALLPALALGAVPAWFLVSLLTSDAARAETLQDALAEAYNTNPQLLAERANLRATDEGVNQALAGWRPTLQFTSAIGKEKFENTPTTSSQLPAGYTTPRSLDFKLIQPVYQGGQTVAKTAQAEDTVRSERAHLIALEGTVLFNVISAYFDVLRDQAVVALDRNNENLLAETLKQTQAQFRSGLVTRTDVAQAEARLQAAHAQRQQDEGTLQSDRANYARYVGHAPANPAQPTIQPQIPASRAEALGLAATKNPNVISALFGEDAARDFVAATEAQLLPSVNLVGEANRTDDPLQLSGHETTYGTVQAQLSVPLYEAGLIYSESRQAKQKVGQSEGLTDDARRFAVEGATAAWETIQAQRANIVSQRSAIRADQIAYDGLKAQQRAGLRTLIDVLNAEQELFADRTNLIKAQHDLAVAEFNLADQVGRLTAADLKLAVNLYDVNRYYEAVRSKWLGFGPSR